MSPEVIASEISAVEVFDSKVALDKSPASFDSSDFLGTGSPVSMI